MKTQFKLHLVRQMCLLLKTLRNKKRSWFSLAMALVFSLHSTVFAAGSAAQVQEGPNLQLIQKTMDQASLGEAIRHTLLSYSLAATPQGFADTYLTKWKPEDQKFFAKLTKGMNELPAIRAEEQSLIFKDSLGFETKIDFILGQTKQFRVNGSLWSYNPNQPLGPQLEIILRSHPPKKTSGVFYHLLFPEAQAVEPLTMSMLVVAVVTGLVVGSMTDIIKQYGTHYICSFTLGVKGDAWYSLQPRKQGFCKDWDDNYKKSERMQAPKLDAIEQMIASDKSNVLTKFKVEQEYSCPSNNDGKDRLYDAKLKVTKTDKEVRVKINFNPQGKVKDYSVFSSSGEQLAKVDFDTENFMKCAKTINEKLKHIDDPLVPKDDPLTPSEISLCRENTALSTEEKGKLELIEDSARFLNLKISKCTTEAVAQKVAEGKVNEIGSPAAPKPNDQAVPSKPARDTAGSK